MLSYFFYLFQSLNIKQTSSMTEFTCCPKLSDFTLVFAFELSSTYIRMFTRSYLTKGLSRLYLIDHIIINYHYNHNLLNWFKISPTNATLIRYTIIREFLRLPEIEN